MKCAAAVASFLTLSCILVGCQVDEVQIENSTYGYAAKDFRDVESGRSDANLDPPLPQTDFDDRLEDHMDRQRGGSEYEKEKQDR